MSHQPMMQAKANAVGQRLTESNVVGFDPASILAIIATLVKMFTDCKLTPAQAEQRAAKPRLLDRFVLRRIIKAHGRGDHEAMEAALLDAGEEMTASDFAELYKEAKP